MKANINVQITDDLKISVSGEGFELLTNTMLAKVEKAIRREAKGAKRKVLFEDRIKDKTTPVVPVQVEDSKSDEPKTTSKGILEQLGLTGGDDNA